MTEQEWLTSADPVALVNYLIYEQNYTPGPVSEPGIIPYRRAPLVSNRKLRLFACSAFRAYGGGGCKNDDSWALASAENHADGLITDNELRKAYEYIFIILDRAPEFLLRPSASDAAESLISYYVSSRRRNLMPAQTITDLLREIVGNPFRPQPLLTRTVYCDRCNGKGQRTLGKTCGMCDGSGQTKGNADWLTPTVQGLASAAYEHRTPDGHLEIARLAVLADALEEAGVPVEEVITETVTVHYRCVRCGKQGHRRGGGYPFEDMYRCGSCGWSWEPGETYTVTRHAPSPLLGHLRGPGPHVRGCWLLDLVLGKN